MMTLKILYKNVLYVLHFSRPKGKDDTSWHPHKTMGCDWHIYVHS